MTSKEILADIKTIFSDKWTSRAGRDVPDVETVRLGNDAVTISGTVLYADMADSTGLVNGFRNTFAAEIYKAYLVGACKVIRKNGGEVTAFDGDRVMAVFNNSTKNTSAAKSALQINYLVREINSLIKLSYPNTTYTLNQTVGIDTSDLFVAKTGIRSYNDLVWVGRAANYAAKLCAIGDASFPSYITEAVFNSMNEEAKFGGELRSPMWEKRIWTERGIAVYRSSWWWKF
ncbi:MAG TPA: adenylate/guanylate cyclase domain-containing protein [Fibrobacteria bacterium]|nr:adenylate/guanylate cyclase domain-containing protein [Fibrobacteria bacterium]